MSVPANQQHANDGEAHAGRVTLLWLTRFTTYVGPFAGAGGAFFLAWMACASELSTARSVARSEK
jgi:hypothetical protein